MSNAGEFPGVDFLGTALVEDLEPLFKIFYTFVCFKVSGKITDKYMKNLKEASGEI